ncbi:hypothetical protein [Streptomyces rubradiris]|uniref:PLAT domain-containing protein n=1 Tax=Streptomyces rubradiris TaxID=285531 RepID=A0ABQ3RC59_STRRR|nr:hypothetical protein [Streptomyces rubradiris]GHG93105.1 hypothetical protein GCM10018792_01810 [Streptomyces rubradiris]GHI53442.1 hypothetical protein Srubr_32880 [Streptomyces rubradiris]
MTNPEGDGPGQELAVADRPVAVACDGGGEGYCAGPTLSRAELFTLTGDDDNKDHDTGIYITVKTSDEKSLLASINNADSSGKDMTTYNDDSHHIVPLVVEAPGARKWECSGFRVRMWIKTNGNDNWTIDVARVTLYFSDGTTLVAEKFGFNLDGDGATAEFASL